MASVEAPRTRGHKKKARTRRQLLGAAVVALAEEGEGFGVVDVVARAGVSHGTFYNYFADRDALVAALVPVLVEAFAAQAAAEVDEDDPAARFAVISARALAVAAAAPDLVRASLRLDAVQRALLVDGPLAYLRDDLVAGHARGRFDGPPDDGTVDVVLGALLLAARRIVDGEAGLDHRRVVIRRLLVALGVETGEAGELADRAVARSTPPTPQPAG